MKLKSHSGTKKRIKVTKSGKFLYRKPCKQHLLINKSKRQKASYVFGKGVDHGDCRKLRRLLPTA